MTQALLDFDAAESEAAKQAGIDVAAGGSRAAILELARQLAVEIARSRPGRTITADDVVRGLVELGYSMHALGNSAGALFRGKHWKWTGRFTKSERVHAHCNTLRVWQLVEDGA